MEELKYTVSFINVGRMILLTDVNIKKKNPFCSKISKKVYFYLVL